jgi:hypothetical protein
MSDLSTAALAGRLTSWLRRLMPADERRDALVGALTDGFGADPAPVTAEVCRRLEETAHRYSRHLALSFDPDGTGEPDTESTGWPEPDAAEIRRRAAAVTAVRRDPDGGCHVAVAGLDPLDAARPYLDAAVTLARGATGLTLDLRDNGGGDPATVAHIAGLLLGDAATPLSTVVYRDRVRRWCTPELPAGTAVPADLPVTVLVGPGTFSSGEALAYHLQARGRVTVLGSRTPGAADHITPIRLAATVTGYLPEAYVVDSVTGTNWEGRGVVPDVSADVPLAANAVQQDLRGPA